MRASHLLTSTCLAVVILLLMSVSVQPVMAAEAINEKTGYCPTCSTGDSDPAFPAAGEGQNQPSVTIREISPGSGTSVSSGKSAGSKTTVTGTEKRESRMVAMDVRDPRLGMEREQETLKASAAGAEDLPASILANLSDEGYDLTGESTHRYESTVTSGDLLALNSSQKAAIIAGGAVFTADDSVLSFRDMTYYAFTNRTTHALRYVVKIQPLDTDTNPVGEPEYAYSPEFPSGATASAHGALVAASGNSCFWKWVTVIGIVAGLAVLVSGIIAIATATTAVTGGMVWTVIGPVTIALINFCYNAYHESDGKAVHDIIYWIEALTQVYILIPLIKAVYELGICMGWWEPESWKPVIWSYQYSFTDAENGQQVPAYLNDRFALTLAADTVADTNAHWEIESRTDGLLAVDEKIVKTENVTLRSWLIAANRPGNQVLVMHYVTDKPLPPAIPGPVFTLTVSVSAGSWTITPVTEASEGSAGRYSSLVIGRGVRPGGTPYISYYDDVRQQVRVAIRDTDWWGTRKVADSAGTYSTSIALDPRGSPVISFGDGTRYGNLMYATLNGTQWEAAIVDRGIGMGMHLEPNPALGDAGQYSSLKTDSRGFLHISYNEEIAVARLKYAEWNGTDWRISDIDNTGVDTIAGLDSSLALDAAGNPHISYRAGNNFANLMYTERTGDTWTITKVDRGGSITGDTGYFTSLALDSAGDPHIGYYDERNGDLRYASRNGSVWTLETVDSMGDVGKYTSLVIDDMDEPHIGYYDATNHALKYATPGPEKGKWVTKIVDDDGDVGQFASVALDPAGHPCFSYYDATRNLLKYAEWEK